MIKEIIKAVLVEKFIDDETAKKRINICEVCPYKVDDECGVCGCFYELKAEMEYNKNPKKFFRLEKTHCPNGFWNDTETANHYRQLDGLDLIN